MNYKEYKKYTEFINKIVPHLSIDSIERLSKRLSEIEDDELERAL